MKNQGNNKITQGGQPRLGSCLRTRNCIQNLVWECATVYDLTTDKEAAGRSMAATNLRAPYSRKGRTHGASYRFRCPKPLEDSRPRVPRFAALGLSAEGDCNV